MKDLIIDMTSGEVSFRPVPEGSMLGGRSFIDWHMTENVEPSVHPLSPENVLIVAPGMFAGTAAPTSGRISLGGKSPLTGGIKEANSGGTAGHKLGRLGIRSIVVKGRADEWQVLKIDSSGASLLPAGDVVGLLNYAAAARLRERFGESVCCMLAGPAGEKRYANSSIAVTDMEGRPARHAARGGLGAVMGSKMLKAIVVDDAGGSTKKAADPEGFKQATKAASDFLRNDGLCGLVHKFGTAFFYQVEYERGSSVSLNHRAGTVPGAENMSPESFERWKELHGGENGHRCLPGCVVACSNIVHDSRGNYLTASFEFETMALCGTNLGLTSIEEVATLDRRCDDLGMDTIETGATIGLLSDAGLYTMGDFANAMALLDEVAEGTPLGRIVGNGVASAAKIFGIDRVPAVKGQAIPGHAARSSKGWGVTYATSPQGADHTTGAVTADPLSPKLQVDRSRWSQIVNTAMDATGFCHFTFLYHTKTHMDLLIPMIATLYGIDYSIADFVALGKEMLLQEREFNRRAGIGQAADRLPNWMRTEKLQPTNEVFDVPQEEIDEFFDFSKTTEFIQL